MFKPLNNYVLMETVAEESKTAGGIIIPDTAREKPVMGRVIATGDGEIQNGNRVPMTVAVGDTVLFAKWASTMHEVKLDGHDYVLIKESDILGIVK
ncbi:MAG: co-chaperone GroES [Alphaproteobacteria bacterium]|nr:co-chaperone GroES [Alphaproteobacteria bacterium]